MSAGEQQAATSFGDPNARPPTPQRTPTAVFSSSLLQTPKQLSSSHLDEASGWTPRFAEEYSVFNSTPGNLRGNSSPGSDAPDLDFVPLSPVAPSTGRKRPLSAGGLAVEIAAHANHFTADPASLAPVDPARRLPSSSDPLTSSQKDAGADPTATPKQPQAQGQSWAEQQGQRSAKKPRRASVSGTVLKSPDPAQGQSQTATPPPSSRGRRKLAPKPQMDNMQNQGFPQADFSSAQPPPQLNTAFVTGNPGDVFSYPVGPATAPPITGPRPFWGLEMDASGMDSSAMAIDVDLSTAGTDVFQTSPTQNHPHGQMNPIDWGRADQLFQQQDTVAQGGQQHYQQQSHSQPQQQSKGQNVQQNVTPRRERALAPKTASMSTPNASQPSPSQNFLGSFQMMDNPFGASPGGVDPGLLFSQPTSSAPLDHGAMSMSMDATSQHPTSSAPAIMSADINVTEAPIHTDNNAPSTGSQGSSQNQQRKKVGRAPTVTPSKKSEGRPNLSRSFSESARGAKRTVGGGRNSLPTLAPARPVTVHQPSLPPPTANQSNNRGQAQGGRPGGRSSPLKSSHHHRLSSLTSIPENTANPLARSISARRTSVKFVIDENGRARAETIVDEDDELEPDLFGASQPSGHRNSWGGHLPLSVPSPESDDESSSSSDDEPIIIPSRNTSFSFPDPPRGSSSGNSRPPTASGIFSQNRIRQRSFSDRHSTSSFRRDEADTVEFDAPPPSSQPQRPSTGGSLSDAAAELRKVMQAGNPRRASGGQQPLALGSVGSSGQRLRFPPGPRSSSSTISEASLPGTSPTQGREQSQVRCVCNRPEAGDGAFLVKCDSCDCLLHGRCVDMPTPHDVPHVYICAFCANTPNMRGGRMRHTGRTSTGAGAGANRGSPVSSAAAAAAAAALSSPLAHKSGRSFR